MSVVATTFCVIIRVGKLNSGPFHWRAKTGGGAYKFADIFKERLGVVRGRQAPWLVHCDVIVAGAVARTL